DFAPPRFSRVHHRGFILLALFPPGAGLRAPPALAPADSRARHTRGLAAVARQTRGTLKRRLRVGARPRRRSYPEGRREGALGYSLFAGARIKRRRGVVERPRSPRGDFVDAPSRAARGRARP